MRIGVDTGGTFTDCVTYHGSEVKILKVFSTPNDSCRAILDGIGKLAEGQTSEHLDIVHGTTVGTNSLLERRGASVALVTTAGFEDLIEIGRQARPSLYDLNVRRDPPLVPVSMRWGVQERVSATGVILSRPTRAELQRLCAEIEHSHAESIAVCFLFSFAHGANERTAARALRRLGIPVSVSHEILPEFREYERLSTIVINAYLAPLLSKYFARLQSAFEPGKSEFNIRSLKFRGRHGKEVSSRDFPVSSSTATTDLRLRPPARGGRVYVMQSSGGITSARRAAREPVRTILSGPAGGVAAAAWLAERLKIRRAISFDMGGTSTDVCLLHGQPQTTHESVLGGLPVAVPVLDVHSVGAGGGSLARIDVGGALRVGPESSGAAPGPVCYGRGGTLPTVTDANLLLGRLDPDHFLGGTFPLDLAATDRAFVSFLRHPGPRPSSSKAFRTPSELARGIVAVVNANMERALRVISVERGYDPRDFALICFGGAGGLHAADLARALGITLVIVPQNPGGFSALGVLLSDIVKDVSQSVLLPVPCPGPESDPRVAGLFGFAQELKRRFVNLEQAGRADLRREGFSPGRARIERRLDVRYAGQAYELSIPFSVRFTDLFHREHERVYGHAQPGRALEVVNLRVRLTIPTTKPRFETGKSKLDTPKKLQGGVTQSSSSSNSAAVRPRQAADFLKSEGLRYPLHEAIIKEKSIWFEGGLRTTPLYRRDRLRRDVRLCGPAVVVEYSSTTIVPPDYECAVDEHLNLVLSRRSR